MVKYTGEPHTKDFIVEKLIKSKLGQWKIVNALNKAWVSDERESTPAKNLSQANPNLAHGLYNTGLNSDKVERLNARASNRPLISGMMKDLSDAYASGSERAVDHHADRLRNYIANASPGTIDLAHLSEEHKNLKDSVLPSELYRTKGFNDADLMQAFDRHIGDAKNLHQVYDEHGIGAVRGLAHANGMHSSPYETSVESAMHGRAPDVYRGRSAYSYPNLAQKPHLIGDVQAFVDGSYGNHNNLGYKDKDYNRFYEYADKGFSDPDQKSHRAIVDSAYFDSLDSNNPRVLEDAVVNRGISNFKHAHGIK